VTKIWLSLAGLAGGALQYERLDDGPNEEPDEQPSVIAVRNGPLFVRGDLKLATPEGQLREGTRFALCRCGHSRNKPHCDNSHRDVDFKG